MSTVVLVVSVNGKTETTANEANQPLRISLPEGAVIETRDEMSGQWLPLLSNGHTRHRFTDFSIID